MADGFGRGLYTHRTDGGGKSSLTDLCRTVLGLIAARRDQNSASHYNLQQLSCCAELSDLPSRSKLSGRLFRYSAGDHHPPLTTDDDVHYGESESSIRNAIAAGETSSEVRISFCVSHFVSLFFLPAICLGLYFQVLLRRNLGAFTLERRRLKGAKCW